MINIFKNIKIIVIHKLGKQRNNASHYCLVSLLSTTFNVIERLILNQIQPEIEKVKQAGFRTNCSYTEQIFAPTTLIEKGFPNNNKTNAVFIYLTAAYDTIWRHGLLYKLTNVILCKKIIALIENMLINSRYQVSMGDKSSR